MKQYLELLQDILDNGVEKENRTGVNTIGVFGRYLRFDLQDGFPLVTTKKMYLPAIIHELLWFLKGSTNIAYLKENKVRIWDKWADENGELGPVYGKQWRRWLGADGKTYDQIVKVLDMIRTKPNDRRLIVNAWKVDELDQMALPPCHLFFQFYVAGGRLSLLWYQRSVDTFLGLPFNIASYSLLTMIVAQVTELQVGEVIASLGDTHLYVNHLEQVKIQLSRKPLPLPKMVINPEVKDIDSFVYEDFALENYQYHPKLTGVIAV